MGAHFLLWCSKCGMHDYNADLDFNYSDHIGIHKFIMYHQSCSHDAINVSSDSMETPTGTYSKSEYLDYLRATSWLYPTTEEANREWIFNKSKPLADHLGIDHAEFMESVSGTNGDITSYSPDMSQEEMREKFPIGDIIEPSRNGMGYGLWQVVGYNKHSIRVKAYYQGPHYTDI